MRWPTPASGRDDPVAEGGAYFIFLDFLRRLSRNRLAVAGGAVVLFFFLLSAFPHVFSRHDPNRIEVLKVLQSPSRDHPLGTDELGRDVLARMVYGAKISLKV